MRRAPLTLALALTLALTLTLALPAFAQSIPGHVTFVATQLQDDAGNLLASGTFTFYPVLTTGSTTAAIPHAGGGGRAMPLPVVFNVVNGVASPAFGNAYLLDVTQASPANFCYKSVAHDNNTGDSWQVDACYQPAYNASGCTLASGVTTCNYDNYIPSGAPGQLVWNGVSWQGAWSSGSSYGINQGVAYNGSSYVSTIANNTSTPPSPGWQLVASIGATGATGATGAAATVSIGTTTTGAAGSSASVTNSGTSSAAVLNFTIPQGASGAGGLSGMTAGQVPKAATSSTVSSSVPLAGNGASIATTLDTSATGAGQVETSDGSGNTGASGTPLSALATSATVPNVFNVKGYGAKGNERFFKDAAITSGSYTLTSATAGFSSADTGRTVTVEMGADVIVSGTYSSGITATGPYGTGYCNLTFANGATATLTLTGTNTIAANSKLFITSIDSGYSSAPTTATVSNGISGVGTVTTVGTAVTGVTGTPFLSSWAGETITINSVNYVIASVQSATALTLTGSAGTQSSPVAFTAILATCSGTPVLSTTLQALAVTTTATYVNSTTLTLAAAATTTVTGAKASIGTDDSTAVIAALAAAYNNGGGKVYFPAGPTAYLVLSQLVIPNNNTGGGYVSSQPAISIVGDGAYTDGGYGVFTGAKGASVLDLRYSGAVGKIQALGAGLVGIKDLSIEDHGYDATPFFYSTNATAHIKDVSFVGPDPGGSLSSVDAILLGGTDVTNSGASTSAFGGYVTTISDCSFYRIEHELRGQSDANAVVFHDNWGAQDSGGVEAILFSGQSAAPAAENQIYANNIETINYLYGMTYSNSVKNSAWGDVFWDPSAWTQAGIQLANGNTTYNTCGACIVGSSSIMPLPLYVDNSGANHVVSAIGTGTLQLGGSGSSLLGAGYVWSDTGGLHLNWTSPASVGAILTNGAFYPTAAATMTLGTSSRGWANIYAGTTNIVGTTGAARTLTLPNADTNTVQPLSSAPTGGCVGYIDSTGTQNGCGTVNAASAAAALSTTGSNGQYWGVSGGSQQWLTPPGSNIVYSGVIASGLTAASSGSTTFYTPTATGLYRVTLNIVTTSVGNDTAGCMSVLAYFDNGNGHVDSFTQNYESNPGPSCALLTSLTGMRQASVTVLVTVDSNLYNIGWGTTARTAIAPSTGATGTYSVSGIVEKLY